MTQAWCGLGRRCFGRQGANEDRFRRHGEPAMLCRRCEDRVTADVMALPRDYVDLTLRARARARVQEVKRPLSILTYLPLNEVIFSACAEIHWVLTCWEPVLRERAGLLDVDYRRTRAGFAVQSCARVIAHRIDLMAGAPPVWGYFDGAEAGPVERDGIYAIEQLTRCHRRAMAILDLTDPVTRMPGPCPDCGLAALRRRRDGEHVYCDNCRARIPWRDYPKIILDSLPGAFDGTAKVTKVVTA